MDYGITEGAKTLAHSIDSSREASKSLSKSIEGIQKDGIDVAQKKAQERRREQREAEHKKQTALIKALEDWQQKEDNAIIAWKVFFSLAKMISQVSNHYYVDKIAFSGGVFQNALLNDLLIERLSYKRKLYFHQQLSPNDECIGFGLLACYSIHQKRQKEMINTKDKTALEQFQFPN